MPQTERVYDKTGVLLILLAADTLKAVKLRAKLKTIARQKNFPKLNELSRYLDASTEAERMKGSDLMVEFAKYFPDIEFVNWFNANH